MSRFRRHVFVCTNKRPPGGRPSCGAGCAPAVCTALQHAVATNPELCNVVAVTPCGCLGPCFEGPNLVIYPEGVWYAGVTVADIPELVTSHLVAGIPLARLTYSWPED